MADRRTRPHSTDRRMISDRTARTLRTQASALHTYRDRRFAARRYTADFILHPDNERSEDDEDEAADILEASESSRGAPALYDAYAAFRPSSTRFLPVDSADRLRTTVTSPRPPTPPTPLIGGDATSLPPPHPPSSTPLYLAPSGPSSALTRQRTLRRLARSRGADFNDFTSRRRSIVRQHTEASDPIRAEDSADGTWRFSSLLERPSPSDTPSSSTHRLGRRFFPLASWSDPHLRIEPDTDNWTPDTGEPSNPGQQSSSQLWHQFTGRPFTGDRSPVPIPQPRRGAQTGTESTFARYSYPPIGSSTPLPDDALGSTEDRTSSRASSAAAPNRLHNLEMEALDEASRQLLTPRSISPAQEISYP